MDEATPETPDAPTEEPPRLLVIQLTGDQFNVHQQGVTDIEAPTLLRMAAKAVEDRLGL